MTEIQILNPIDHPEWDDLVLSAQDYSLFHSSSWARVMCECYNYIPRYFTSIDRGSLSVSIPLMEVRGFLGGRRAVSLPFSDYCEPIIVNRAVFPRAFNSIIDYGKRARWFYVEFRGGEFVFQQIGPSCFYYQHILDLKQDEKEIFSRFRSSTRQNIKNAVRDGVNVAMSDSMESLSEFYRLHRMTRKHQGLPPQPSYFFEKIYQHLISTRKGFVVLATWKKRPIAGAVCFHFGKRAILKYSALDRRYQSVRPSNLVMWEAIRWYAENGFDNLSFGRTQPGNKGLLQFKNGWGATRKIINYYKYDLSKSAFVKDRPKPEIYWHLFKKLPLSLLSAIGSLLYRYTG